MTASQRNFLCKGHVSRKPVPGQKKGRVEALGDETPERANYSIAYLRHFHVTKQNLCLKTNLKHRLELGQPIRGRTQAGDVSAVIPLAEA